MLLLSSWDIIVCIGLIIFVPPKILGTDLTEELLNANIHVKCGYFKI